MIIVVIVIVIAIVIAVVMINDSRKVKHIVFGIFHLQIYGGEGEQWMLIWTSWPVVLKNEL